MIQGRLCVREQSLEDVCLKSVEGRGGAVHGGTKKGKQVRGLLIITNSTTERRAPDGFTSDRFRRSTDAR